MVYSGTLVGARSDGHYDILLLGSIPFLDRIKATNIKVGAGGRFNGELQLEWAPRWIVLIARGKPSDGDMTVVAVADLRNGTIPVDIYQRFDAAKITTAHAKAWNFLARMIRELPHPPQIDPLLVISSAVHVMTEVTTRLAKLAQWRYESHWDELASVLDLADRSVSMVALFGSIPPESNGARETGVTSINMRDVTRYRNEYRIRYGEGAGRPIGARLMPRRIPADGAIRLISHDELGKCLNCSLIALYSDMLNHRSPYKDMNPCVLRDGSVAQFGPGDEIKPVSVGILTSSMSEFRKVADLLAALKEGEPEVPEGFQAWLRELGKLPPPGATKPDWLAGLLEAMETLELFAGRSWITLDGLIQSARTFSDYENALHHILDWVELQALADQNT